VRIAGVNVPTGKQLWCALTYIYGIGPKKAREICQKVGIPEDKRVYDLDGDDVLKIRELVDKNYKVEGTLRSEVAMNVKRLMDIGAYRGSRHSKKLPRSGRTRTNARTLRGRAVAIAGKKKVAR